jgi:hypothetical protein
MKSIHFVCLLAILVSVQLMAQTFAPAVAYGSGGNGPNAVAVADVNGDNIPDLVVANWCTDVNCTASSVGVLLGDGDGTFQPAVNYGSGGLYADAVAVADVNGDGKVDIVVGNCGFPKVTQCANGNVAVLLNNGDGTFQAAIQHGLSGAGAASLAIADVNGDSKPDVLVATGSASGGFVDVLLGNGDGTLQTAVPYSTGGLTALSVAVADVNGDTLPDLIVANWCPDSACTITSTVGVLLNSGGGIFQSAVPYPSGGFNSNSVVIEDVNGDGKLDLVVGNGSTTGTDAGNVGVLLGNGDGTFQSVVPYARGGYGAGSLALTDVNGDSKPDLVVANCSTSAIGCTHSDGDLTVLLGNGDGTFQTAIAFGSGGTTPFGVAVGDLNADGKPDVVAANCVSNQCGAGAGELGVLLNTAPPAITFSPTSLTFSDQVIFTTSPAQQVTLTNSGAGVLKINHIGLTGPYSQANNCPGSLNPGANCTISVKFHPTTKGVLHGAVRVSDNAPGSPQRVPLAGIATLIKLSPTRLNFGTQPVGTKSLAKRIAVTNKGDNAVNITRISITGADAEDFAQTNNCGKQLSSGASCFIKVTFKPLAKGKRIGDVSLYDNGGGSPQQAILLGTGT